MRYILVGILFSLLSCASSLKPEAISRFPATISRFPEIPEWGYLSSPNFVDLFNKWNVVHENTKPEDVFYAEDAPDYGLLNRRLMELDRRVRMIVGNPNVPVPRLVVVKDPSPNAFVLGLPVCIRDKTNIVYSESLGAERKWTLNMIRPDQNGPVRVTDLYNERCLPIPNQELAVMIDYLQRQPISIYPTTCHAEFELEKLVFRCEGRGRNLEIGDLIFKKTMPYIFVTAGLMAAMTSEDQWDAVVAHELGHYYLGHAFDLTLPHSYFYQREGQNVAFRPTEGKSMGELGKTLLRMGSLKKGRSLPGYFDSPVAGEILMDRPRAMGLFKDAYTADFTYNLEACAPLWADDPTHSISNYLYGKNLSPEVEKKAKALFETAKNCTQSIVRKPVSRYGYLNFFAHELDLDAMAYLAPGLNLDSFPNAWEAFRKLEPVVSQSLNKIHEGEALRHAGYYTYEEEADVFAINYLLTYGRSQASLQEGLANLVRYEIKSENVELPELEDCIAASENHWTLKGKNYTPLPLDFSDPHHGFCFRLFNIESLYSRLGAYASVMLTGIGDVQSFESVRKKYEEIATGLGKKPTSGTQFSKGISVVY